MKKNIFFMSFSVVFLCGVLLFIGYRIEENDKDYYSLEQDMISAADIYITTNNIKIIDGEFLKISDSDLINDNLIKMDVNKDKCSGYVLVKNKHDKYTYSPYIKCNNYKTTEE